MQSSRGPHSHHCQRPPAAAPPHPRYPRLPGKILDDEFLLEDWISDRTAEVVLTAAAVKLLALALVMVMAMMVAGRMAISSAVEKAPLRCVFFLNTPPLPLASLWSYPCILHIRARLGYPR